MRLPFAWLLLASTSLVASLAACGDPSDIAVSLAPDVVSSIDGTLHVRALVLADRDPVPEQPVTVTVDYKDRNGTPHEIAPVSGSTDETGTFEATVTGLTWDGTGTVTAATESPALSTSATFAVLDRTPPAVTIMPPPNNQVRIGTDVQIMVNAKDEIGISQVFFDATAGNRNRSEVIASGAGDTTVGFTLRVENVATGSTVTLFALAADLSGNQAAAQPVMVTVVP